MFADRLAYFWNYTARDALGPAGDFLRRLAGYAAGFLGLAPWFLKAALYLLLGLAAAGILASHFLGIYKNRGQWKKHRQSDLTFSYFCGAGSWRRHLSYAEAHRLLRDRGWWPVSFAGLACRLGNFTHGSQVLLFLCSLLYIPLAVLGFFEMALRIAAGTIWLYAASFAQGLFLLALGCIARLLIPLWQIADKAGRANQQCPHCYATFDLPAFQCPGCGAVHKQLIPGRCGILFARCQCGRFLPASLYTGRSKMQALCPVCGKPLFAANARPFSIQLAGGRAAGKTAFLAAFQHIYLEKANGFNGFTITGEPRDRCERLEQMYETGRTEPEAAATTLTYSFIHTQKQAAKHNLVIFDIPGEAILSGAHRRNPRHPGFPEGVILILDPLSIPAVREECRQWGDACAAGPYVGESVSDLIAGFTHHFSGSTGRASRQQNHLPVAVVINKADLKAVEREIGRSAIKAAYEANPGAWGNDPALARDGICRAYLSKRGLDNALNNLEGAFAHVRYFPVSATGPDAQDGKPFAPWGVPAPFQWIAWKARSPLFQAFNQAGEDEAL